MTRETDEKDITKEPFYKKISGKKFVFESYIREGELIDRAVLTNVIGKKLYLAAPLWFLYYYVNTEEDVYNLLMHETTKNLNEYDISEWLDP